MGIARRRFGVNRGGLAAIGATTMLVACLLATASALAAPPTSFGRFCFPGVGAGECEFPRGVATDATTGHIFLADQNNNRVEEFTAWGEFVKAWGWGVRTGAAVLQTCTTATGCQKGVAGNNPGQFSTEAQGVAVDSAGNVYVVDRQNFRVQKFDPAGNFLLMFGGGVDQGPNHPGDVCTAQFITEGDTCRAGTSGGGNGQFSPSWAIGSLIAVGPGNEIYVGDANRIQVFNTAGVYQRQLPLPKPGSVQSLAVEQTTGDLYIGYVNTAQTFEPSNPDVYRLNSTTGAMIEKLAVDKPASVATDLAGNVYVFDQAVTATPQAPAHQSRLLIFDSNGDLKEKFAEGLIDESTGLATGSHCFTAPQVGIYASADNRNFGAEADALYAYGEPDPVKCPPPAVPPEIEAQFASSVGSDVAVVKAEINAHYFTGAAGTTTYYLEWATAQCVEAGGWTAGCVKKQPAPPGPALNSVPTNAAITTTGILLSGLAPATEYTYRFVTEGSGAAGEPVIGVGGEPGVEGAATSFTTMPTPTAVAPCPNDSVRLGFGANLPDCRGYELVSPLDKAGGDAQARLNIVPFEARMDQTSTAGDALTYSAYRAFSNPVSAPFSSQYLARRGSSGWQNEAISPPQEGAAFINALIQIDNLYRAFSPDLGFSWLQTDTEPVLGPGGLAKHPNIYRRNADGSYEGCTTAPPQLPDTETQAPQIQGYSADGSLGVFRLENKLTANASSKLRGDGRPIYQLYACSFEGGVATVRFVSALPNGQPSELENTIGGSANQPFQFDQGRAATLENAVSADGSKVFWTAGEELDSQGPGALYVRLRPAAPPTATGKCEASEPEKACTQLISGGPARFYTASEDGAVAIYSTAANQLREYKVATKSTAVIAQEVIALLGASENAKRIYFLSEADLDGDAVAGEPNLYVYDADADTRTFIGTLSSDDTVQGFNGPTPSNREPAYHAARVTPDGSALAFMSNSQELAEEVAEYDNTDQLSGEPAAEVYRYAIGEGLTCVSCNRTGARPTARQVQNKFVNNNPPRYAASKLPPWLNSMYAPGVLSADGQRVYFEAYEPLVLADTNGKADVYQWELAGTGTCQESGNASFDADTGGCLTLISSGKSTADSQFVDATPSGGDVFIRTSSSLVTWDPDQIDIYDARIGGGFEPPPTPPAECEGELCQTPAPPPTDPTPSSSNSGPGNVKPPKKCGKGKHKVKKKGKTRCVKKAKKKGKKANTGQSGRSGR